MNNHTSKRTFGEEFKLQMVQLYSSGKSNYSISRKYDISTSVIDRWIKRIKATGSTKESDNRTPEQIELST